MLLRLGVDVLKSTDEIVLILKRVAILYDLAKFADLNHLLTLCCVVIAYLGIKLIFH